MPRHTPLNSDPRRAGNSQTTVPPRRHNGTTSGLAPKQDEHCGQLRLRLVAVHEHRTHLEKVPQPGAKWACGLGPDLASTRLHWHRLFSACGEAEPVGEPDKI